MPQQETLAQELMRIVIHLGRMEISLSLNIKIRSVGLLLLQAVNVLKLKSEVSYNISLFNKFFSGVGNPGPGHYDKSPVSMHDKGVYYVSKLKNSGCNFFNK